LFTKFLIIRHKTWGILGKSVSAKGKPVFFWAIVGEILWDEKQQERKGKGVEETGSVMDVLIKGQADHEDK